MNSIINSTRADTAASDSPAAGSLPAQAAEPQAGGSAGFGNLLQASLPADNLPPVADDSVADAVTTDAGTAQPATKVEVQAADEQQDDSQQAAASTTPDPSVPNLLPNLVLNLPAQLPTLAAAMLSSQMPTAAAVTPAAPATDRQPAVGAVAAAPQATSTVAGGVQLATANDADLSLRLAQPVAPQAVVQQVPQGQSGKSGDGLAQASPDSAQDNPAPALTPSVALTLPVTASQQQPAQWAPIRLPAAQPAQWAQPLQQALGERLNVQAANGIQNAVIRLDPPHLGSLEIAIRHEGGSLQVQLTAGNNELLHQLHSISDNLRQGLGNRQYGEVSVWVADSRQQAGSQGGQGRQQREQQRPGQALHEAEQGYEQTSFSLG